MKQNQKLYGIPFAASRSILFGCIRGEWFVTGDGAHYRVDRCEKRDRAYLVDQYGRRIYEVSDKPDIRYAVA